MQEGIQRLAVTSGMWWFVHRHPHCPAIAQSNRHWTGRKALIWAGVAVPSSSSAIQTKWYQRTKIQKCNSENLQWLRSQHSLVVWCSWESCKLLVLRKTATSPKVSAFKGCQFNKFPTYCCVHVSPLMICVSSSSIHFVAPDTLSFQTNPYCMFRSRHHPMR